MLAKSWSLFLIHSMYASKGIYELETGGAKFFENFVDSHGIHGQEIFQIHVNVTHYATNISYCVSMHD